MNDLLSVAPDHFPGEAASFALDGPAGKLECEAKPAGPEGRRDAVAVICHPLSTDGGSMHNKVVTMVERALRESGVDTVIFNFRSVGRSEGAFDHGNGESDDLAAVVAWVRTVRPGASLWLAGFSFGSYVTLRNAVALGANALVSIAPPAAGRGWDFAPIALPSCRWLVVMGDADEIVEPQAVYDWVDGLPDDKRPALVRMEDTSHFFHRRLMDLRGVIKHAVKDWPPLPASA
ncbi:alpha/beta hydrolase [Luteibacter sp. PPL201]|uniref:Alpha/beta hydrolase n=1 Tax=Luteibacter sahnii TaxID=3021977 RepID=A0ABT6BDP8_9GAMM|nr:alpha/beta hydrolase [Luteibacter sp. PPL193]MDY1548990.1 alpha/beta hydrolase [Luteibacter sp. PPL193]